MSIEGRCERRVHFFLKKLLHLDARQFENYPKQKGSWLRLGNINQAISRIR